MILQTIVVIVVLGIVAFCIANYLKNKSKKPEQYVWVGPGQDPFKQKEEEEEEEFVELRYEEENEEEE